MLKSRYDNLKKATKKKVCEEKKYTHGTGGGPSKVPDLSSIDEQIKDILGDERIEGLPSQFDNDSSLVLPFSGQ